MATQILGGEERAEGAGKLGDNGALNARDNEGTVGSHQWHVGEEEVLRLLGAECLVHERDGRLDWRLVGAHILARESLIVLGLAYLKAVNAELKLLTRIVSNGRELLEELIEAVGEEPGEGLVLVPHQVGERDGGRAVGAESLLDELLLGHVQSG